MPLPWLLAAGAVAVGKVLYDSYKEVEEDEARDRARAREREYAREAEREAKNKQEKEGKESILTYAKTSLNTLQNVHTASKFELDSTFDEIKNIIFSEATSVEKIERMLGGAQKTKVESNLEGSITNLDSEISKLLKLEEWVKSKK